MPPQGRWREVLTRLTERANCQPAQDQARNVLSDNFDILEHLVMPFVDERTYLFVASVSRHWKRAWGNRPKLTSRNLVVQSRSCLDWAHAAGLDVGDGPSWRAAAQGRLEVLQHAVALGYTSQTTLACEHAAGGGHLDIVRWCHVSGLPWGRSSVRAAEGGHFEVLRYCRDHGCPWDPSTVGAVARGGHLDILDWCWDQQGIPAEDFPRVLASAVEGGQLEVVRWCRTMGCPWAEDACYQAARNGNFELLKTFRENGCPWSSNTMCGAVESGNLLMLTWCKDSGCPWHGAICRAAARCGDLEILQWCVANEDPGRSERHLLCGVAAAQGHLHVLQLCRANEYPWGIGVCFNAASGGHFEVLKWCVANGCEWGSFVERHVGGFRGPKSFKGSVEMMTWANSNGCPWMCSWVDTAIICKMAAEAGNIELLRWCSIQCLKLDKALVYSVTNPAWKEPLRRLENQEANNVLPETRRLCRSVQEHRSEGPQRLCGMYSLAMGKLVCLTAAKNGDLKMLQWCWDQGYIRNSMPCSTAARLADFEILKACFAQGSA